MSPLLKKTEIMKKLLFSLVAAAVCMLSAHSAFAQDIILMTDSEVIEATVIEINDDQVVYKAYDNPDGPVYKMSASKISKITFANGTEEVFGESVAFSPVSAEPVPFGRMIYEKGRFIWTESSLLTAICRRACLLTCTGRPAED